MAISRGARLSVRCLVGLWLAAAGLASAAPARVIDDFGYPGREAAAKTWRPAKGSPPPAPTEGGRGLVFPCPFKSRELTRAYWDRAVSLDLSGARALEFDLSCDNPQAIRSFNVYLESGKGWYVWSTSLPEPGRQRLLMLKGEFAAEGRPAGWHRISRIRLSAWPGVPGDASVTAHGLKTAGGAILLVRNTLSTDSPAERSFAAKVTERLSRWLKDMDISHGIVTDDEVAAGGLAPPGAGQAGARVAVLPYNPHPPAKELNALRRFVRGGGKLVVFYGADPDLAALMHVRLGAYKKSEIPGTWDSFRFEVPGDWEVPERVFQKSFNIFPVHPADRSARVIAHWENAEGRRTGDPAWLASDSGLWMTHVLLDDDVQNKRLMLTGLLGVFEPTVWPDAARACLDRAVKIDSFRDLAEARTAIAARAAGNRDVEGLLERAANSYQDLLALYRRGKFREVVERFREVRSSLTEAYGRVQPAPAQEFRGVWDHDGTGWYPGDWDRTCRILADRGITAVFPNMIWGARGHYPSKLLNVSYTARNLGDQMDQCTRAARAAGLQVHVWAICWQLNGMPADFMEKMRKEGRLQVTPTGRRLSWLCPSHPQNIALELNALKEVAGRYEVDGVHLDYIRFPGEDACYCSTCRAAFERSLGAKVSGWPRSAQAGGRYAARFRSWRAGQITSFVRAAARELRALKPGLKISAAVWGNYPACVPSVGQDWALWLKEGIVDFVCPMNYTVDVSRFASLTHGQLALPRAAGRVYPGLGVTAAESQLRPDQVIEQVVALRKLGAAGFMLFDLSDTLREDTLPALRWCLPDPAR